MYGSERCNSMRNQKLFIRLAVSALVVILLTLFIQQITTHYSFALSGGPGGLPDRITYLGRHYDNSSVCGSILRCHTFQQNLCMSQQQLQRNKVGPLIQVETLLSLGPGFSSHHPILAIQTEYRQL